MADEIPDSITLDVEDTNAYLRRVDAQISVKKAQTANVLAYVLLIALVASLPAYVIAVSLFDLQQMEKVDAMFEKWYSVVSPLAGAALGAYFISGARMQSSATRPSG